MRVSLLSRLASEGQMYEAFRWQDRAVCGKDAPERDRCQFTNSYPSVPVAIDLVRRYCHHCPVMMECRDWATGETAFSGIAGGAVFAGEKSSGHVRRITPIRRREEVGNICST